MADPTTVNIALTVPLRAADPGTWDIPVNGDFTSIDGFLGGVATVALTNANVTLTAPSGSITPSPGPSQSQNAVLRLTGTLTGNVIVTLPLPGYIIVDNRMLGAFVVTLRAVASGEVIGLPPGSRCHVFNDGTNVRFVDGIEGRPGALSFEGGEIAVPAWITTCTVRPYLLCDGSIYNISDYPYLGAKYGSKFGGNGVSTFGVQNLGGRVPLAYDNTGTRITAANCGINGQTMGAAGGLDGVVLDLTQIPPHNHGGGNHDHEIHGNSVSTGATGGSRDYPETDVPWAAGGSTDFGTTDGSGTIITTQGGGLVHTNVQPAQVAGIWLCKT